MTKRSLNYKIDPKKRNGSIKVNLESPLFKKYETKISGKKYLFFHNPERCFTDSIGTPELPREFIQVAIPDRGAKFELKVSDVRSKKEKTKIPVIPVAERTEDGIFHSPDKEFYGKTSPLYNNLIEIIGTRTSGGIRVLDLVVNWVNYTPNITQSESKSVDQTGELEIINSFKFNLGFIISNRFELDFPRTFDLPGKDSSELDDILGHRELQEQLESLHEHEYTMDFDPNLPTIGGAVRVGPKTEGEYLIIIDEENYCAVKELVTEKRKKYSVKIVTIQQIMNDFGWRRIRIGVNSVYRKIPRHEAILSFMLSAYYWDTKPKHLLLVGDHDVIPGYLMNIEFKNQNIRSDQRYTSLADDDWESWCTFGRICTNDFNKIEDICNHIVNYKNLTQGNWTRKVTMAGWVPRSPLRYDYDEQGNRSIVVSGLFPDAGELEEKQARGFGDLPDPLPGEASTWHYVNQTNHYNVARHFQWKECHKDNQETDCTTHSRTYDVNPLLNVDYWGLRTSSRQSLIDEINDGTIIMNYSGHGTDRNWVNIGHTHCDWGLNANNRYTCLNRLSPGNELKFWKINIDELNTQNKPPFVISNSCMTGEIYDINRPNEETFSEKWQRDLKAIAIYAADVSIPTYFGDTIGPFIFEAIVRYNKKKIGEIIVTANRRILNRYTSNLIKDAIRTFRIFGDPDTELLF